MGFNKIKIGSFCFEECKRVAGQYEGSKDRNKRSGGAE